MGRPRLSTYSPRCCPVSYYCLHKFQAFSRLHPIHVNHGDTNAKSVAKFTAGRSLARLTWDCPAIRASEACGGAEITAFLFGIGRPRTLGRYIPNRLPAIWGRREEALLYVPQLAPVADAGPFVDPLTGIE
jgi:hypothetical protein